MAKPDDREANIEKLDRKRIAGQRAAYQQQALEEVFEARQKQYVVQLIAKTTKDREVATDEVWKLVALNDLLTDLRRTIGEGRKAERVLAEMAEKVRSETHG